MSEAYNDTNVLSNLVHTAYLHQVHYFLANNHRTLSVNAYIFEQERLTCPEHLSPSPSFSWIRVAWSLVLCEMLCISLFLLFSFFFRPLSFEFFFDLRIVIPSLTPSNSSWQKQLIYYVKRRGRFHV